MSKTLREQMVELGLVSELRAKLADEVSVRRLNHACYKNASRAAERVDRDHREVIVEYRRARACLYR